MRKVLDTTQSRFMLHDLRGKTKIVILRKLLEGNKEKHKDTPPAPQKLSKSFVKINTTAAIAAMPKAVKPVAGSIEARCMI